MDEVYYKPHSQRTDFSLVNQQIMQKVLKRTLIVATITAFLSNCASQQPAKTAKPTTERPAIADSQTTQLSALTYIEQAQGLMPEQAAALLIQASEQYLIEKNPEKALWLANQTQSLATTPELLYKNSLAQAGALIELAEIDKAQAQLQLADQIVRDHQLSQTFQYFKRLDVVERQKLHPVRALNATLNAFALNEQATEQDINAIWAMLNQLSQWQLEQLIQMKPPYIDGWKRLSQYARQFGAADGQFKRYLTQWLKQFPLHPAQTVVNELLNRDALLITEASSVAVLLPLSGNQSAAGKVAQQGILAAYEQDKSKNILFIDTNALDWSTLDSQLITHNVDYIIGPLLRANVDQLLALEHLTVPTLLLNLPGDAVLQPHQTAISMRPEDEAIQAAASLVRKEYKNPIMLVHEDSVSHRIADAFSHEWFRLTGHKIEVIGFEQGKNMQDNLKASLDLDKSQARIKAIDARVKQTIKYEARNRRDVDMIYIIGSAAQTRLLKPHIDVNISPFANTIPIYASSRSHSAKMDEGDVLDLSGLTFTEMPWLIPSKQQNSQLFELVQSLFPNRGDSLQGIFAMGYDSLALIDKIPFMLQLDYVRHYGQTGVLKLNANNILTRSILWGQYDRNRVQEIVMD